MSSGEYEPLSTGIVFVGPTAVPMVSSRATPRKDRTEGATGGPPMGMASPRSLGRRTRPPGRPGWFRSRCRPRSRQGPVQGRREGLGPGRFLERALGCLLRRSGGNAPPAVTRYRGQAGVAPGGDADVVDAARLDDERPAGRGVDMIRVGDREVAVVLRGCHRASFGEREAREALGLDQFHAGAAEKRLITVIGLVGERVELGEVVDVLAEVVQRPGDVRVVRVLSVTESCEVRSANITASTMPGKMESACGSSSAWNQSMYTSIVWLTGLNPDGVPGPVLRGMVPVMLPATRGLSRPHVGGRGTASSFGSGGVM